MKTGSPRWSYLALTTLLVLGLDQITKALVDSQIASDQIKKLPLGLELVNSRNDGVAFGLLASGGVFLILLATAITVAAVIYFARKGQRPLIWLPIGLLLGGALGNVIDRIRIGAVVDFINLGPWPTFNIADIAITFGVLTMLVLLWKEPRDLDR